MSLELQHCRSCNAPIYWCTNVLTGKKAPIDAAQNDDGNCVVYDDGSYHVLRLTDTVEDHKRLHTNHFQTCPNAKDWKRAKEAKA